MSFKREGNDAGLLGNLRRRRIKELLSEDVPEDEAKLLCNGRFACLVCSHRPIFDTVDMLTVHRKGKKHAASEALFLQKKKELKHLILKRQHEQFMRDGTTVIRQAATSASGGIGVTQPYDPRVKRHKVKPYERKPRLALEEPPLEISHHAASGSQSVEVSPAAIPLRHTHQLKNIFRPDRSQLDPAAAQPYQSKRSSQCNIGASEGSTVSASSLPLSYSHLSASHSRTAQIPQPRSEANVKGHKPECGGVVYPGVGQGADWAANLVFDGGSPANCDRVVNSGCVVNSEQCGGGDVYSGENVNTVNVTGTAGNTGKDVNSVTGKSAETNVSTEKRKLVQQYLHLRGSGWKKDWDGKWIRDEDAEFDSDEEPPDLP